MRQTSALPRGVAVPGAATGAGASGGEMSRTKRVAAVVVATTLAVAIVAFWIVASIAPILATVSDGQTNIPPGTPVKVSVWNLGGSVQTVTMTEAIYDMDGNPGPAREVPVRLVPSAGGGPWRTDYRVERADGSPLFGYDGLYGLNVAAGSVAASLVGKGTVSQQYEFTSLPSPRLRAPEAALQLDYQAPAQLTWNQPIETLRVETVPALDVQTRIDPANPALTYVDLPGAKPDTRYEVRVLDATAVSGGRLVAPVSLTVVTPAPPAILADRVKMEDGYRITIPWDMAIKSFDYEITPAVASTAAVSATEPKQSSILLQDPKQGQKYTVKIKGAIATTNAPLAQPREVKLSTPNPLDIVKFDPQQSPYGVSRGVGINVGFSEPVKDRRLAERAIKISPAVPGKFVWKSDRLVQFAPTGNLPPATDFTVSVAGGRDGVVGADGAYLDKPQQFAFRTVPEQEIEVNLSSQTLTLWEGGHPVWDTLVASGVRGAETPTGLFSVLYKMDKTRMQGVNPSGHRYDLPDVPWVMPFLGDYAMHGAYWRESYGTPQSNGCVSMPTAAAKYLYDRVPEGTPVRIHY